MKIMDCTLRDGANVVGNGFSPELTKMMIEGLLRHIKTEFQWNTTSGLMILVRTYVRCHSNSRKETGNSPLHINSLQSIRIITRPELIKIWKQSIIDAGTATST